MAGIRLPLFTPKPWNLNSTGLGVSGLGFRRYGFMGLRGLGFRVGGKGLDLEETQMKTQPGNCKDYSSCEVGSRTAFDSSFAWGNPFRV